MIFLPLFLWLGGEAYTLPASHKSNYMASEHPFQILFETLGRLPIAHSDAVNRHAFEVLSDVLTIPVEKVGRCILLRAPRAGYGKTHLLSRVQHHLAASHEFIPLHAAFGSRIDAASVTDDTLRRLLRLLPASGGLSVLDLVTRRLFAMALQPLVGSGEVPCQDRDGALTALRMRPIETFDFHHPNAVTAHWARENFEILGQRLSMEIAQRSGLPVRGVAFWVENLFRFAATPPDNPARLRTLTDAVHEGNPAEGVRMERLETLLGMLALLMRVVFVADDLEGFSSDESAALGLAAFLGSLRHSVERLDVILSLNQDVWDSAFLPRLSGGLADRLSEVVIELGPLSEVEMIALIDSRSPGLGVRVLERMNRTAAGSYARGVIRAAGDAWLQAAAGEAAQSNLPHQPPVASVPVVVPPDSVVETVKPAAISVHRGVKEDHRETPVPEPEISAPIHEMLADEAPAEIVPEGVAEHVSTADEITTEVSPAWETVQEPEPLAVTPAHTVFPVIPESVSPPDSIPQPSVIQAPAQPSPTQPQSTNTDRVDELLRQFRERYGRESM